MKAVLILLTSRSHRRHINGKYTGCRIKEPEENQLLTGPLLHQNVSHLNFRIFIDKRKLPHIPLPEVHLRRHFPARCTNGNGMPVRNLSPKLHGKAGFPLIDTDFYGFRLSGT